MVAGSAHIGRIPAMVVLAALVGSGCADSGTGGAGRLPLIGAAPALAAPGLTTGGQTRRPHAELTVPISRYFGILNRLEQRMDAGALARLFTPDCPCQQQVRAIRDAAARGERFVDRLRINAMRPNVDGPLAADVLVDYDLVQGERVDATGRQLSRSRPHRVWWDFRLVRRGSRWLIARIDAIS